MMGLARMAAPMRLLNGLAATSAVCRGGGAMASGSRTLFVAAAPASRRASPPFKPTVMLRREYKIKTIWPPRPEVLTLSSVEARVLKAIGAFERCPTDQQASQRRAYGSKQPFTLKNVEQRIMLILCCFDKIDAEKLTMDTHLINDLGLDSLDHVEIIMAIEDEFTFEIPDGDAERLMTPREIFQYICDKEDVYE